MKTPRTRNLLAAALATALLSPLAWAHSDDAARNAAGQAQQVPRAPTPPAVTPRLPVDAADPVSTPTDPQRLEEPMTSSPPPRSQSQGQAHAAPHSSVVQREGWSRLDTDGDGRISAAEASADADFNSHFSMMDSDGDGYVSADEYRAHARSVQRGDMPPPPPSQAQGAAHAAPHSSVVQREAWSRLDTDGDGRISSVEASLDPMFSAHFSAMDADGDGFVTDAEYRAFARTTSTYGDADIDEETPTYDDKGVDEDEAGADDHRDGG